MIGIHAVCWCGMTVFMSYSNKFMFADTSFGLLLFLPPSSLLSLRRVIEEFEMRLVVGGRSSHLIKAVDTKFRKQIQELHVRYTKVCEMNDY